MRLLFLSRWKEIKAEINFSIDFQFFDFIFSLLWEALIAAKRSNVPLEEMKSARTKYIKYFISYRVWVCNLTTEEKITFFD